MMPVIFIRLRKPEFCKANRCPKPGGHVALDELKMAQVTVDKDAFRDSISTVDKDGKRVWVYPKKPAGKLYEYRKLVSYGFLALLFAGPFLKINGASIALFPEFFSVV